jgi:Alternative complex III, ActD subunit
MATQPAVMAIFEAVDGLFAALKTLKTGSFKVHTVYSPVPLHEVSDVLELPRSPVRLFTLVGGILGILTGMGLTVYTCLQWKFIVSGKPIIPWIPAVVVGFEFCILIAILFNLIGLLTKARLPRFRRPEDYDSRFTRDRFGLLVLCAENERETLTKMLRDCGAEEVHEAAA